MAVALYATILTTPSATETIQRYLYRPTEVIEVAPVIRYAADGSRTVGDLVFLILRTEEFSEAGAQGAQQQQCDRLASGLHGMTIGFSTRESARAYARSRTVDNDWGIGEFAPFVLTAD